MANVTEIIQGRADAIEQRSLVKGFISTSRPAPKAFTTTAEIAKGETTNLLWVIVPEHSTEVPYGPCNWAALHGSSLPAQGAACVVALDQNNRPTVIWWEGNGTPALVSALPSNPTDGQECYFQNTAMAEAGVVWTLRYRTASASSHKWEFVGGGSLSSFAAGPIKITLAKADFTQQEIATAASLTLPLAGDYEVSMWIEYAQLTLNKHSSPQLNVGVGRTQIEGPLSVTVIPASIAGPPETTNQFATATLAALRKLSTGTPNEAVKFWCGGNDATVNLWQIGSSEIYARPVRVG